MLTHSASWRWPLTILALVMLAIAVLTPITGRAQSTRPIEPAAQAAARDTAKKAMVAGNWKDAYQILRNLATDPLTKPDLVETDLHDSINCLNQLSRFDETDDLIEESVKTHPLNWRLLRAAAQAYLNLQSHGSMIAGTFVRGPHRGGTAKFVYSHERDRIRALQLMARALEAARNEPVRQEIAYLHLQMAHMLLDRPGGREAWRLGYLTDLTTLPDYEDAQHFRGWHHEVKGAPVDAEGNPMFHTNPKTWDAAQTDGQRWRWCLMQAMENGPSLRPQIQFEFASFMHEQFDVQTMAHFGVAFGRDAGDGDDGKKDESGPFAVKTLGDDETIARLATGIKRFKLPDEFNFIAIFKSLARDEKSGYAMQAITTLAQIYENRQQYPKAAEQWKRLIAGFGSKDDKVNWQARLDQIIKPWGQFETVQSQPDGSKANVDFRFRNADKVKFEATLIDQRLLLSDLKDYFKARPKPLDWNQVNLLGNIGYHLVEKNQTRYLKEKVAAWDLDLMPRPNHFDRRQTITTPLTKAGAYFITATVSGEGGKTQGNTTRIVMWVADTVLIKIPTQGGALILAADAATGQPLPKLNLEFFGYRQRYIDKPPRHEVDILNFAEFTDENGQYLRKPANEENQYQWMIIGTSPQGRLAHLGFTNIWTPNYYDQEYNQTKTFFITDRPVYRPEQTVKIKAWINTAKYDVQEKSPFAGRDMNLQIHNPMGQKVWEKSLKADEFGGIQAEFPVEKSATLGVYQVVIGNIGGGQGTFRIEEYKKPEFEVNVDAPDEPVALGEKITATIKAKYLFGAPVAEGKVKYKILRTPHDEGWYPIGRWDWFYGRGYWWFGCDYPWYPGWREWGCRRPYWPWWGWRAQPQPELVAEVEAAIAKDGITKVVIDTAVAKAIHGDQDHRYEISAEVTDNSRRTIVGTGAVLVARKPFKVYTWVDRGHYRVGDVIHASFRAQTIASKPVKGTGEARLLRVSYDKEGKLKEDTVEKWPIKLNDDGQMDLQIKAGKTGQYRLSCTITDTKDHKIDGGYVFTIAGEAGDGAASKGFRFNDIELVPDQREYKPGQKVQLKVNANLPGAAVWLFVRPANGVYLPPKLLRLQGKSTIEAIDIVQKDMPNLFVEAVTVSGGRVFNDVREIVVPPESRVINVDAKPQAASLKPGAKNKITIKLTEANGEPFVGSTVVSVYDKAVEYISGGSNVPEIKAFFWKWRRSHQPQKETTADRWSGAIAKSNEATMGFLGVFGANVAMDQECAELGLYDEKMSGFGGGGGGPRSRVMNSKVAAMRGGQSMAMADAAPAPVMAGLARSAGKAESDFAAREAEPGGGPGGAPGGDGPMVEASVRTNFADTALWVGALTTNPNGEAEVELTMPESLTTWKARVWAMGAGTRVGEATTEIITTKNLLVRLQAPRFFVEKDEVVISANVHNYLKEKKRAKVQLEIPAALLAPMNAANAVAADGVARLEQSIDVEANGEKRVDWRIAVRGEGQAFIRVKALTNEESDAMEMKFPVHVHGMLKTESFTGVVRPDKDNASITLNVPKERRAEQTRLEIRYSPTLAGAMVDALPYLVDYPHGCTEQTLNRFLPTVLTQHTLMKMGLDLKDIQKKRTNLNAQEIGDDKQRAEDWKRMNKTWIGGPERNPVFDDEAVRDMVKEGVARLTAMQCNDGGWGWFSGWGEHSYPHTTATVVHGLQLARDNDVALVPGVLERGVEWLKRYQAEQLILLKNGDDPKRNEKKLRYRTSADNLDALVYMVLVDAKVNEQAMQDYLYRDRNNLAVYAKSMVGLALNKLQVKDRLAMIIQNIDQFLVNDDENQTAYLKLPENNYWWCWYGSEYEAQAYYLKLLAAADPKGEKASRLVKYLLNNRKNATYWKSTRDTAICVEAFADYIKASGEDAPDMTVQILIDGKQAKEVKITKDNLFSFDNKLVLEGAAVADGKHTVEVKRVGKGSVYFNAYLTNFTLEDPIAKAGLEIKVNRKYYKLVRVDASVKAQGSRGQAVDEKVEKYKREPIAGPFDAGGKEQAALKSGDLIEVELEIDSKNDYEYIIFEDMKAAGFEPVEVRSGYNGNDMGAYVEFRDERVCFFVRALARGKHSVSYRLRAEIPGSFSALPTKGSAMYAPELKANSDEMKVKIVD